MRARALGGDELERGREARLGEDLALLERMPVRGVDARPVAAHREDRCQHRQAGSVGRGHRHAIACEAERRLDEPRPRQPPEAAPESVDAGGKARHRTRARPDGVVDELFAERHLQRHRRRTCLRRHVDEAIEVPCLAPVPVDGMRAAEKSSHHRLGDAGGKARGDRGVGCRPAVLEDLDPGRHRGGMARCNTAWEHGLLP